VTRPDRLDCRRAAALVAIVIVTVAPAASASASATAVNPLHQACGRAPAGHARCYAEWRAGVARTSLRNGPDVGLPKEGYGPPDIASAYQLDTSRGRGETVGIVDAFDEPNIASDLNAYRAAWGLPPCTAANGCFRKVNQRGGSTPPSPDPGWGVEIALDVEAVSAACPNCRILLVEANEPSFIDLGKSVNTAVRLGADVVSNSYGNDEYNGIIKLGNTYYRHPGVAVLASSGDFGFGAAQFPAVLRNVIAVGGTTLTQARGGWKEQAWGGAGSGCSAWIAKPSWQHDGHCQMRTVADISAVADPDTGFAVYDTYGLGRDNGWIVVGGTSLSSPLIAGMIGLAGNAGKLDSAAYIYGHRSGLYDVVGGSNGFCGRDYLCTGVKGYDGPSGLGSPRGLSAL